MEEKQDKANSIASEDCKKASDFENLKSRAQRVLIAVNRNRMELESTLNKIKQSTTIPKVNLLKDEEKVLEVPVNRIIGVDDTLRKIQDENNQIKELNRHLYELFA